MNRPASAIARKAMPSSRGTMKAIARIPLLIAPSPDHFQAPARGVGGGCGEQAIDLPLLTTGR